jgi:hypothetical protein
MMDEMLVVLGAESEDNEEDIFFRMEVISAQTKNKQKKKNNK